jgi:hypothetical protein
MPELPVAEGTQKAPNILGGASQRPKTRTGRMRDGQPGLSESPEIFIQNQTIRSLTDEISCTFLANLNTALSQKFQVLCMSLTERQFLSFWGLSNTAVATF